MALIMIENHPKVKILKGRVIIFKIGFTRINNNAKTIPPRICVVIPPDIFKPVTIWDVRKSARE